MNQSKLSDHLRIDRYGDFQMTAAIRPALHLPIIPVEGFRLDTFRDEPSRLEVPVLAAAVSREKLFDVFLALLEPLGMSVDVVLETSHDCELGHRDLLREGIDLPVLMSHLCEFEEHLLDDGCTGVAVISSQATAEIQFDEHKLLVIYAHDLEPFEAILRQAGIPRNDQLKLITEGEHLHSTSLTGAEEFEQLCCRVGVSESVEQVSW